VFTPLFPKLDKITIFIYESFTIVQGEEFEEERGDETRRTNIERGAEARRTTAEDKGERHRNISCFVA